MRSLLFDFIADFSNWDASFVPAFLDASRALTQAAHQALRGVQQGRPIVADPFAGGGAIPLEGLRVGAEAYATDLNPLSVALNKMVLQYVPRYGKALVAEVKRWGAWVEQEAFRELAEYYPVDSNEGTPIAYLWARTVVCEGPQCGAEVPLIKSLWLGRKPHNPWALAITPNLAEQRVDIGVVSGVKASQVGTGTVRRGAATCPICGYTTPADRVRRQLALRKGGANDARLICVVTVRPTGRGRYYRQPNAQDFRAVEAASAKLRILRQDDDFATLIPDEPTPEGGGQGAGRAFSQRNFGMDTFDTLFTERQLLSLATILSKIREAGRRIADEGDLPQGLAEAVQTALAFNLDKIADYGSSLASWSSPASQETVRGTFSRQAIQIVWDFAEAYPLASSSGGWSHSLAYMCGPLEEEAESHAFEGQVAQSSATAHPLPDDSIEALVTDPPYYDAIPYADLSDFFIVWLKRSLGGTSLGSSFGKLSPKVEECVVDEVKGHDAAYFERTMREALSEGRRVVRPDGIGVVVFAHKSTKGWVTQLQAMIDAGWVVTGSWPIDTERQGRVRANASAALASSIHLVCRPRENPDGSVRMDDVGDWRSVLAELPARIHQWMPRLGREGIVGADAIFACLGPALEIFSRYSRVEKATGEAVLLDEYLEHVWAAVAREGLSTIFEEADATGFDEDARLTAMWLWTINAGSGRTGNGTEDVEGNVKAASLALDYDTVRKIAQGLGAHLDKMPHVVEIKGDTARLLPVSERAEYLFGTDATAAARRRSRNQRKTVAPELFPNMTGSGQQQDWGELGAPDGAKTVLDKVHQAMLLFGAGRADGLKRLLADEGVGSDAQFWKLAQALSALYPVDTEEKRWVDGVLARKKGLGF